MADRVDALGGHRAPAGALTGRVLDEAEDPVLQEIVKEAAAALRMPIALVSLVLDNCQYFRAHTGLPDDLRVTRATDRDVSFCQFVVRDGQPVTVPAASADATLPQLLVREYGIESYLGVPVKVGPTIVGTLCVLDVERRDFSPRELQALGSIALRASHRLAELADRPTVVGEQTLLADATRPTFAEIRNKLTPIAMGLASMRLAVTEVSPALRLLDADTRGELSAARALGVLGGSRRALEDLRIQVESLETTYDALMDSVLGLEALLASSGRALPILEVINAAVRLSAHHTRPAGGVRLSDVPFEVTIDPPAQRAIAAVALALAEVGRAATAARGQGGISIEARQRDGEVAFRITSPGLGDVVGIRSALHPKLPEGVAMRGAPRGVELRVPATAT